MISRPFTLLFSLKVRFFYGKIIAQWVHYIPATTCDEGM